MIRPAWDNPVNRPGIGHYAAALSGQWSAD